MLKNHLLCVFLVTGPVAGVEHLTKTYCYMNNSMACLALLMCLFHQMGLFNGTPIVTNQH